MAGHSKWAQIKHKKAITDAKKGKLFSKLVREVMIASKVGGTNPEFNTRLRAAIERAHAEGVPKDNIERAQVRGSKTEDGDDFKEFLYEATGAGGIAILIEGNTDNTNRTVHEIKHLLAQYGGRLVEPGSLVWNFKKIGTLEVTTDKNPYKTKDDMELVFIEAGAKDFTFLDNQWMIETDFTEREQVRKELESRKVVVSSWGHDYKPLNTIMLDAENLASIETLLDALTDHDDVQEVYTNLK